MQQPQRKAKCGLCFILPCSTCLRMNFAQPVQGTFVQRGKRLVLITGSFGESLPSLRRAYSVLRNKHEPLAAVGGSRS